MKTVTITVGWTRSAMPDYSSFSGWKRGASQHTETLTFDVPDAYTDEQICDVVFHASNSPDTPLAGSAAFNARVAIDATGYDGRGAHYSLSVGDTVTIEGKRYACESLGWRLVELMADVSDEDLIALTRDPDDVVARLAELAYAERDTSDNERMFRKEARDQ